MPNLGPAELLMILVVALVLFGPRRLPELGKTVGQALRSFPGSVTEELKAGLEAAAPTPPLPSVIAPAASVPAVPAAVSSVVLGAGRSPGRPGHGGAGCPRRAP